MTRAGAGRSQALFDKGWRQGVQRRGAGKRMDEGPCQPARAEHVVVRSEWAHRLWSGGRGEHHPLDTWFHPTGAATRALT